MKRFFALLSLVFVAATLYAQSRGRIFLDPNDPFTPYFSAAMQKKGVPITITTDPTQADFTVQFRTKDSNGSIIQGILTGLNGNYNSGAYNEATITVVNAKTKDVTFSYTCKKFDRYSGADGNMATSVAECLAKHWKSSLK